MIFRVAAIVLASCALTGAEPERDPLDHPNIVVILADDLGWGDLSLHGNPDVATPNLDGLAKAGSRLERFYVSPASAPSRATILTGRQCLITGVTADAWGANVLHENELTFAEVLRDFGYQTGYFGSWQNGANPPHDPVSQGFQVFGEISAYPGFVEKVANSAFCAFVSGPSLAGATLANVHAQIQELDGLAGTILAQLDALGLARHTIVVFLSDCGPVAIEGRFDAGLFGTKGSLHEGGLRVPSFWRWTGVIPPGQMVNRICGHADVFPTLLELAGAPLPADRPIHGMNLAPLLIFGDDARWPNRNVGSVWVPGRDMKQARKSYRTRRWAAIDDPAWRRQAAAPGGERWELYDLLADPRQHYDVAENYTFVLAGLKSDIMHWFHKSQVFGYPVIPTRVEGAPVRLTAEAALFPEGWAYPGEISALDLWGEPDFEAHWPLEVAEAGSVEVAVEYRLDGGEVRVRFWQDGGGEAELTLGEAVDWTWVAAGDVRLNAGEGELRLRAGGGVGLEIREVRLTPRE